jgi:outer membrane receptor protein involved in Fe transport
VSSKAKEYKRLWSAHWWLPFLLLFSCTCLSSDPIPTEGTEPAWLRKSVLEVLEAYSDQGFELIFSTQLVTPDLLVLTEPKSQEPLQLMEEILQPHGLTIKTVGDKYLVTKIPSTIDQTPPSSLIVNILHSEDFNFSEKPVILIKPKIAHHKMNGPGVHVFSLVGLGKYTVKVELPGYLPNVSTVEIKPGETEVLNIELQQGPAILEQMSVSASRYVLSSNSQFYIDQQAIQALPELGDPIRYVQRLQGAATNGLSSMAYLRGGLQNENGIYLNGLKLLAPFHFLDYHSIFSFIDTQAISGIQVYTGGFPVEYGDDMSGMLLLDSIPPEEPVQTSLGVSFFTASLLNSGHSAENRVDWLVSARKSTADWVLKNEYGKPHYFDIFATLGVELDANSRLTINGLYAHDDVTINTEDHPTEYAQSISKTRNENLWFTLDHTWSIDLSSSTTIAYTHFSNVRTATIAQPLQLISAVDDDRKVRALQLRHEMEYEGLPGQALKWGLEYNRQSAGYYYAGGAEYFGLAALTPGIRNPIAYQVEANPSGATYAFFVADRFAINQQLSVELGLRWDKQTYTEPEYNSQLSPRASLLYALGERKNLRFTIGSYYQPQGIGELQVEDDVNQFNRPQLAHHFIVGYEWSNPQNFQFRLEAYYKDYDRLAPRFENLYDPLQLIPEFQPDRIRLTPQSATAKGTEFSMEYAGSENLSWWASYSLARVTDSISGRHERRDWDQLQSLQLGLAWQWGLWELGAASRIHSGWPTTDLTLGYDNQTDLEVPVPGPRNAEQFGLFFTLDFRISRHFDVHIGELTVFLDVINATNKHNSCCTEYGSAEDANGNLILTQNRQYWIPFVPSLGLLWEF